MCLNVKTISLSKLFVTSTCNPVPTWWLFAAWSWPWSPGPTVCWRQRGWWWHTGSSSSSCRGYWTFHKTCPTKKTVACSSISTSHCKKMYLCLKLSMFLISRIFFNLNFSIFEFCFIFNGFYCILIVSCCSPYNYNIIIIIIIII